MALMVEGLPESPTPLYEEDEMSDQPKPQEQPKEPPKEVEKDKPLDQKVKEVEHPPAGPATVVVPPG